MSTYKSYPSFACWSVCATVDNDKELYVLAQKLKDDRTNMKAIQLYNYFVQKYGNKTPDGARVTLLSCKRYFNIN